MDVSIILASYNGAGTLPRTLEALAQVTAPPGGMEIILVDNNSADNTQDLMQAFARDHGAVVLSEPRQGKAFALNSGLAKAQGRLVVFTDDDTIAGPCWIQAYVKAAERHPEISVYAGQIRPEWMAVPPPWLLELTRIGQSCACTPEDLGEGPIPVAQAKGPNFMVRGETAADLRFNESALNYGATSALGGGEDTDFVMRAAEKHGGGVWYVPDAMVRHIIGAHEMTLGAVFKRYMRIGAGQASMQHFNTVAVAGTIIRSTLLVGAYLLTWQRTRATSQFVTLATQTGRLKALLRR